MNEWQNLANAVDFMKFHTEVQLRHGNFGVDQAVNDDINRMLNLIKCTEFGIEFVAMIDGRQFQNANKKGRHPSKTFTRF